MNLLLIAFIAGILTALAPCVLPLLPIIVGGSLAGDSDKRRPYIIVGSLALALVVFTLLLKATTTLLGVPPLVWTLLSAVLLLFIGISFIWPHGYELLMSRFGLYNKAQAALGKSSQRGGFWGAALVGVALGPVFSSCSPTYALILATVLPVSFGLGAVYLISYALGLAVILLAVALLGRKLTKRIGWALNPDGWFKHALGVLFVVIGLAIATGYDKKAETYLSNHQLFDETALEQAILPKHNALGSGDSTTTTATNGAVFSVAKPVAAPELTGITSWINSTGLTLAGLRGKVVLIDFWTYSCINCIHTLPHVEALYQKYQSQGLVVIGVHAPEFAFEHVLSNVQQAVKDDHITYPVALDNNFATWKAYDNEYWPAEYTIDRNGNLRDYHFGEGGYENSELVIRSLLAENGTKVAGTVTAPTDTAATGDQSPETYLGYYRATGNITQDIKQDTASSYQLPSKIDSNNWAFGGNWTVGSQAAVSGVGATLQYRFSGKQVYLVMGAGAPSQVTVLVNGQAVTAQAIAGSDVAADGTATVAGSRLYRLVNSPTQLNNALLELEFAPNVSINAFTFDS